MTDVERVGDQFIVDAQMLAKAFDLSVEDTRNRMQGGQIASLCESGEGEDKGPLALDVSSPGPRPAFDYGCPWRSLGTNDLPDWLSECFEWTGNCVESGRCCASRTQGGLTPNHFENLFGTGASKRQQFRKYSPTPASRVGLEHQAD